MENLSRCLPEINKYLDFDNLSPYLISEKCLTWRDLEALKKYKKKEERSTLLMEVLQTKGDEVYMRFRRAIERSVEVDDGDCHLGHVDLLKILPKVSIKGDDELSSVVAGLSLECGTRRRKELTDSGLVGSFDERLNASVEVDSPHSGSLYRSRSCFENVSFGLSMMTRNWEVVEKQVKDLRCRNGQLEKVIETMTREKDEVQQCMKVCIKKMVNPNEVTYIKLVCIRIIIINYSILHRVSFISYSMPMDQGAQSICLVS